MKNPKYFLRRWDWISVESSHIFLKVLKLHINRYFDPHYRIILSWLTKLRKIWRKPIYFLPSCAWISVGYSHIFSKFLKLPINPYFRPLDRIILNQLEKIKNMEKSKKFYGIAFGYLSDRVTFSSKS